MNNAHSTTSSRKDGGKPAPARPSRRPWYRLHWSTWIVLATALAIAAIVEIPGRINNHGVFINGPLFYEHGWPFVFIDRYNELDSEGLNKVINEVRGKDSLPWAEQPYNLGSFDGFGQGEPVWLEPDNWTFTGRCFVCKTGLALDMALALLFVVSVSAAYECWSRWRWHYSLRTLFCGIVLVAGALAWWRTAINGWERESGAVADLRDAGCEIGLRCDAPVLLRTLVGANHLQPFYHVVHVSAANDEPAKKNAAVRPVVDSDLEHLDELRYLEMLFLDGTQVTDMGLRHLSSSFAYFEDKNPS